MKIHKLFADTGREFYRLARASTRTHRRLRDRLKVIFVATVGVDLICAVIGYYCERHANATDIHIFGDAIFWATTQLLTVSSQIHNPVTTGGRILDVFMELYAISVVATLAGSFGEFFYRRGIEIDGAAKSKSSG